MEPDTLALTGSLGTALTLASVRGGDIESPRPAPQNPAEVLAQLMDFPGSVAIADMLGAGPSRVERHARAHELGPRLLEDVCARLEGLEPMALKPLTGRRAPELPTPDELWLALSRRGLLSGQEGARSEAAIERLAEELGAPFRGALGTSLRQSQAHVATLR